MADETAQDPTPLAPAPAAKVRMLAPNNVVYAVPADQARTFEQRGYSRYDGPTIDADSIEAKFGAWRQSVASTAKATALGAVNQVPLLDYGLDKVAPDAAKQLAVATSQAKEEHPIAYGAGSVAGAVGSIYAGGAALKAGAGALGIGARLSALAAGSPAIAGLATGAVEGAGLSAADQIDEAALKHALDPEGQEKLSFSYAQVLGNAVLGGAIPGAVGYKKQIGALGRKLEAKAEKSLIADFISPESQIALEQADKGHVVDTILRPLVRDGQGTDEVTRRLGVKIHALATEQNELLQATRDHSLTLEQTRQLLADAQKAGGDSLAGDDLKPLRDILASHAAHEDAQIALSRAHGARKVASAMNLRGSAGRPEFEAAQKAAEAASQARLPLPNDKMLHEVADKLYKRVDFKSPTEVPFYKQYHDAGLAVARGRDALFETHATPELASKFRAVRGELSDHLALAEALDQKHVGNVQSIVEKGGNAAAVGGVLAALGLKSGSVVGSASAAAGWSLLHYTTLRHAALGARKMGTLLTKADASLSSVIKAGLYGNAALGLKREVLKGMDFQTQAARVLAAQRDPVTSYSSIHQALLGQQVPEEVADKLAPRIHAATQAAAQALPPPSNTPDMASAAQPDLHQQRAWLSETRSRQDPAYALAYPTTANMNAAKQHHPQTIMRAQEAVMDALAKNPYLPVASRMWASRVLGRPAGGLTSPAFYQSLAQMRAKADAPAEQSGGSAPQRGNTRSPVAQSEQSRLGELANP